MTQTMTLRQHVLRVAEHLLGVGRPAPTGKLGKLGRKHYDHCLPVLRRYAAGDAVPPDDLLTALRGFEAVAMATSDRTLFVLAVEAREACLPQCSWQVRDATRQEEITLFQSLGIPTVDGQGRVH